jgi:hypothetical protein
MDAIRKICLMIIFGLKNIKERIVRIMKYKITNGGAERFNGKIERLIIKAQGYRDFYNIRKRYYFTMANLTLFHTINGRTNNSYYHLIFCYIYSLIIGLLLWKDIKR